MNTFLVHAGLTQSAFESEMEVIHQKASDFIRDRGNSCRYCWWTGLVFAIFFIIGFVIVIVVIDLDYFLIFGVVAFAIFVVYMFNWAVLLHYRKIWNECLEDVQKHVDELNVKYNNDGVSWMMTERSERQGCFRNFYRIKYRDIVVYPGTRQFTPPESANDGNENETLLQTLT